MNDSQHSKGRLSAQSAHQGFSYRNHYSPTHNSVSSNLMRNSDNPYSFPHYTADDPYQQQSIQFIDFKDELSVIRAENPNIGIDTLMKMLQAVLEKKKKIDMANSSGKTLKMNKKFFDCAEGIVRMMQIGLHNV